ncbi:hypothetical protein F5H01DRAFT_353303 [Linnemannia elongata]|nr:hypothetical protein F5H01DRAFT_353303 [Linnemannia elongata]
MRIGPPLSLSLPLFLLRKVLPLMWFLIHHIAAQSSLQLLRVPKHRWRHWMRMTVEMVMMDTSTTEPKGRRRRRRDKSQQQQHQYQYQHQWRLLPLQQDFQIDHLHYHRVRPRTSTLRRQNHSSCRLNSSSSSFGGLPSSIRVYRLNRAVTTSPAPTTSPTRTLPASSIPLSWTPSRRMKRSKRN